MEVLYLIINPSRIPDQELMVKRKITFKKNLNKPKEYPATFSWFQNKDQAACWRSYSLNFAFVAVTYKSLPKDLKIVFPKSLTMSLM